MCCHFQYRTTKHDIQQRAAHRSYEEDKAYTAGMAPRTPMRPIEGLETTPPAHCSAADTSIANSRSSTRGDEALAPAVSSQTTGAGIHRATSSLWAWSQPPVVTSTVVGHKHVQQRGNGQREKALARESGEGTHTREQTHQCKTPGQRLQLTKGSVGISEPAHV